MNLRYVVGVDEVGRGPIAGPVAVGAVVVPVDFEWAQLPEVGDSKNMTEKARERVHALARSLPVSYAVSFCSSHIIDEKGIVLAISHALTASLAQLQLDPLVCRVLLDGALAAPPQFVYQQTIIRGDASEKVIGLASIMAKVERDRYMTELSVQFPQYRFEKHKGYGTAAHYRAIREHGILPEHRLSFLSTLQ